MLFSLLACFVIGIVLACMSSLVARWKARKIVIETKPIEPDNNEQTLGRADRDALVVRRSVHCYVKGSTIGYPITELPSKFDWLRLASGTTTVKILPASPLYPNQHWHMVRRQHYLGGLGSNDKQLTLMCLRRPTEQCGSIAWVGECPICDHWNEIWKILGRMTKCNPCAAELSDDYKALKLRADFCKARTRYYYQVVPLLDRSKVRMLSLSEMVHRDLIEALDDSSLSRFFERPDCWLNIAVDHQRFRPQYRIRPWVTSNSQYIVSQDEMDRWMASTFNFGAIARSWEQPKETMELGLLACNQGQEVFDLYRKKRWPYNSRLSPDVFRDQITGQIHHPYPTSKTTS